MTTNGKPGLVVGLASPRAQRSIVRESAGTLALDAIAGGGTFQLGHGAAVLEGHLGDLPVVFAKPQLALAHAGDVVVKLIERYAITSRDVVLIYADDDLPFGQILVRERWNHNGRAGIKSVCEVLRTQEIYRVRIGIGPTRQLELPLEQHELEQLAALFPRIAEAARLLLVGQGAKAMSLYNRREHPNRLQPPGPQA